MHFLRWSRAGGRHPGEVGEATVWAQHPHLYCSGSCGWSEALGRSDLLAGDGAPLETGKGLLLPGSLLTPRCPLQQHPWPVCGWVRIAEGHAPSTQSLGRCRGRAPDERTPRLGRATAVCCVLLALRKGDCTPLFFNSYEWEDRQLQT